jgi:hypothetical protein
VKGLETPALTKAMVLAVVKDAIAVAVAFGAPLNSTQQLALLALAASTTALLLGADVAIRHARAKHVAGPLLDKAAADAIAAAHTSRDQPPDPTDPIKAATATLEHEAEREREAHDANAGVDPATL